MERHPRRQFRIGRCLGRGGFGEVYLATMRSPGGLDTEVAVKLLREDLGLDLASVRRLRDEGRMLARARHPSLIQVYDLTRIEGRVGLVTEYVDGDDLDGCTRAGPGGGPLEPRSAIQVAGTVAAGLAAAWSTPSAAGTPLQIVHRDVKPTNIRIGRHGQVKLLDFGVARFSAADRESNTVSDVVVGSVPYLAPERLTERASLPAGDVYGLGCCLYEALVGEPFHADASLRAVSTLGLSSPRYAEHLFARLDVLRSRLGSAAPRELIARMLAFDPGDRPTAGEVSAECEELDEVVPGRALRRWCAERTAWGVSVAAGSLEGKVLTEGELGLDATDSTSGDDDRPARAKLIHRPLGTIDPRADDLDDAPPPARPPPAASKGSLPPVPGSLPPSKGSLPPVPASKGSLPPVPASKGSLPPVPASRGSLPPSKGSLPPSKGSLPPSPPPPALPALPDGAELLVDAPRLASKDSLDRARAPVRTPPSPASPARPRGALRFALGFGCAAAAVIGTAAVLAAGVVAVVLGLQ